MGLKSGFVFDLTDLDDDGSFQTHRYQGKCWKRYEEKSHGSGLYRPLAHCLPSYNTGTPQRGNPSNVNDSIANDPKHIAFAVVPCME